MEEKKKLISKILLVINKFHANILENIRTLQVDILDQIKDCDNNDLENLVLSVCTSYSKESPPRVENYVERVVANYTNVEFQQNFRVTLNAFDFLSREVNTQLNNLTPQEFKISKEKQLLCVLWLLGTPDSYRSVSERFGVSKSTLSMIFFRIIDVLNKISNKIIKFPNQEQKNVSKTCFKRSTGLVGVVGAIDGTYIPVKAPLEQVAAYTNRKCFTSVTLQAICDQDLKFLDSFIGYPSAVHDNRIFRNSPFYKIVTQNSSPFFGSREKILGDKAYSIEKWCIPPYIDRGRLSAQQKFFNKKHASCRQVVERSFALLFGRFRRLKYLDMNLYEFYPKTILAACVLHNICIIFKDENIENLIRDGMEAVLENVPRDQESFPEISNEINISSRLSGINERDIMTREIWDRNTTRNN